MRVLVALGGNALSPRGSALTMVSQRDAVARAAVPLAAIAAEHDLVVTHGNGPQVGLLALQADALDPDNDFGLDILDAETAGMIGYLLEQEIGNLLPPGRDAVTVLTQTVVDPADPAFTAPTKFVGPEYDVEAADHLAATHGWSFALDGDRLRRVVPSPAPLEVIPLSPVGVLLQAGSVVICAGGGGVPVVSHDGHTSGVDAVVDKDAVSALLAHRLAMDVLVIATDVDGVYADWAGPGRRHLNVLDVAGGREADYPAGSMGPKVAAAAWFARTGRRAVIGSLDDLPGLVAGTAGTRVVDSSARTLVGT